MNLLYLDVDECSTANGGCQQLCNNTVGSFFCFCQLGYSLQLNGFNCSGKIFPYIYFYVVMYTTSISRCQ